MSQSEFITVEVAYATPGVQTLRAVHVPSGSTVAALLQQVAQQAPFSELDLATHEVGIFGQVCDHARVLGQGDRLEIYRPLIMDAKVARLARAQQQKEKQKQP